MHWPVHNCLMVEPTETESLATLDRFVAVLHAIADEAELAPEVLKEAPLEAPSRRMDEVAAARNPVLTASI
jgi:glycine dehydrogenase subunit 2